MRGRLYEGRGDAFRVRRREIVVKNTSHILSKWFQKLCELLISEPSPRVYDGNPSAGAEPSPAEREYDEAKEGAKTGHENVVSHTWRW